MKIFDGKCVKKQNDEELENEISILQKCKHPNIVAYLGKEIVENKLYLFMEYFPKSLGHFINKLFIKQRRFSLNNFTFVALNVAKALHYLHTMEDGPIIHRYIFYLFLII